MTEADFWKTLDEFFSITVWPVTRKTEISENFLYDFSRICQFGLTLVLYIYLVHSCQKSSIQLVRDYVEFHFLNVPFFVWLVVSKMLPKSDKVLSPSLLLSSIRLNVLIIVRVSSEKITIFLNKHIYQFNFHDSLVSCSDFSEDYFESKKFSKKTINLARNRLFLSF